MLTSPSHSLKDYIDAYMKTRITRADTALSGDVEDDWSDEDPETQQDFDEFKVWLESNDADHPSKVKEVDPPNAAKDEESNVEPTTMHCSKFGSDVKCECTFCQSFCASCGHPKSDCNMDLPDQHFLSYCFWCMCPT